MRKRYSVWPAVGLFLLAPMVAEFLLGDYPLTMLWLLLVLAPLYGGGSLLIREAVRSAGRGWPTMFLLAFAYAIAEECITTQALFNPNFMGLNLHLMEPAYVPWLHMGGWWTLFVLTLHTVWSISVPIALVESLVPNRANEPWLSPIGLALITLLFGLFSIGIAKTFVESDPVHFIARPAQFAGAAIVAVVIGLAAFLLPRITSSRPGNPPRPLVMGVYALVAGSLFLIIPRQWGWGAVGAYLALDIVMGAAIVHWARMQRWTQQHLLSLAGGASLAYAWHAFIQTPLTNDTTMGVLRSGNAVLALGVIVLLWVAARKTAPVREEAHVREAVAK